MNRALVVVAKEPEAGKTKTRLSPPLSGQQAAGLYRCFLLDTLELMQRIDRVQPIIAYTPDEARSFFQRFAPPGFDFVPQVGSNLGERLDNVLTHCLQDGYSQAVVTDSDSPTLPVDYVQQAFDKLDDPAIDVVLGPCDDGGYYLIGLKSPCPALFREVAMSTPSVVADTLDIARQLKLQVASLPIWYDIDTHKDLVRLSADLTSLPEHQARHTRAFLADATQSASVSGDLYAPPRHPAFACGVRCAHRTTVRLLQAAQACARVPDVAQSRAAEIRRAAVDHIGQPLGAQNIGDP